MEEPDLAALFPWWTAVADDEEDALEKRALKWLEDPYPGISLRARFGLDYDTGAMLQLLVERIKSEGVPGYDDPVVFEAWLRGLIDGASAVTLGPIP